MRTTCLPLLACSLCAVASAPALGASNRDPEPIEIVRQKFAAFDRHDVGDSTYDDRKAP